VTLIRFVGPDGGEVWVNPSLVASVCQGATTDAAGTRATVAPGLSVIIQVGGAVIVKGTPASIAARLVVAGAESAESAPPLQPLARLGPGGDFTRDIKG